MTAQRASVPFSQPSATNRWMTIRQIAADLAVSPSTVYKWSARGWPWFPRAIRLRNGDIRVRLDWYESWLAAQVSCNPAAPKDPMTAHAEAAQESFRNVVT